MSSKLKLFVDIAERAFFTWMETFIGLLLVSNVFSGTEAGTAIAKLHTVLVLAASAVPAALTVIKGAIASLFGNRDTAAALPAAVDNKP